MNRFIVLLMMTWAMHVTSQGVAPILSNFRVEDSQRDRVYFDSSGDLSGLTTQGFVISGKKITGVNTSGKYFTVSEPFTFWDNNTIRLGEITDTSDRQSILHNFTLQYIENNIPEPKGNGRTFYVSTSGSDSNDGLSEGKPFKTLKYAVSQISSGDIIYVKAGDYGNESLTINKSGSSNNPIKIVGYKNKPGDIKNMYFTYGKSKVEKGEMPLFSGNGNGVCITIKNSSNIIFKNIQIINFEIGIESNSQHNLYTNMVIKDIGLKGGNTGFGFKLTGGKNRVSHSVVINVSNSLIRTFKDNNLIDNFKGYSDYGPTNPPSTDYFISVYTGSNNIVRNSNVERVGEISHTGHGISLKSNKIATYYNLLENCSVVNFAQAIELRHSDVRYTVSRNIMATGNREGSSNLVTFRDGTSYNIVENCYANGTNTGIRFTMNAGEDKGIQEGGHHNKVINTVFNNVKYAIFVSGIDGIPLKSEYNSIENCTFYNNQNMFAGVVEFNSTNAIVNSIIVNTPKKSIKGNFNPTIMHSNSYNSFSISGVNNMSYDPKFENAEGGNFRLRSDSPLIDKGKDVNGIKRDFDGKPRPSGKGTDIGAFEYQDITTSQKDPVKADAGKDQTICEGNSATLTATGGTSYQWSTGETTASITVNPTQTTTYSVEVSDGTSSDTDEVVVTVETLPTAEAGSDITINQGESTTLTAIGGDTYIWSTGETTASITVSPTQTTNYEVTVTKNGCSSTDTVKVTVNAPAPPVTTVTADAGKDQTICSGNSATLTATGGTNYKWSTGDTTASITVNPTQTTTYSVEVSDGMSSDTDEVVVTVNSAPQAKAGSNRTIKQGETVVLSASGGDSYLWTTGATTASISVSPNATTIYSVLVSSNGCTATDQVKVSVVKPVPPADANAGEDLTICKGESITLNGSGGESYLWNTGEEGTAIVVSPDRTATYTLQASRGGVTDTDEIVVTVINCDLNNEVSNNGSSGGQEETEPDSGVNDAYQGKDAMILSVYPNPTQGILNLESNTTLKNFNLVLMDMQGGIIYQEDLKKEKTGTHKQIDFSGLAKGLYLLQLYDQQASYVEKVIVM